MKYDVFQINFTPEQVAEINDTQGKVEYYQLYLNASSFPEKDDILPAKHLYQKVAVIEANDLDGVFEVGNIGPEENITRLGRMHSLSVGDVIVDPAGVAHLVASFGFEQIDGWSA